MQADKKPGTIKPKNVPPKPKGVPTHRRTKITKAAIAKNHPRATRGKKATKIQQEQILQEVIYLISNFTGRQQILGYMAKKWELAESTTDKYITQANAHLKACGAVDRDAAVGQALERIKEIRQLAKNAQDIRALVSIENTLAKMLIPERKELSGPDGGPIVHTDTSPRVEITPEMWYAADAVLKQARGEKQDAGEEKEG